MFFPNRRFSFTCQVSSLAVCPLLNHDSPSPQVSTSPSSQRTQHFIFSSCQVGASSTCPSLPYSFLACSNDLQSLRVESPGADKGKCLERHPNGVRSTHIQLKVALFLYSEEPGFTVEGHASSAFFLRFQDNPVTQQWKRGVIKFGQRTRALYPIHTSLPSPPAENNRFWAVSFLGGPISLVAFSAL